MRSKNKKIKFSDFPDFTPNLTPKEMFELGSFGGTYWRPIYSSITDKNYKNVHKKYPKDWWKNIPEDHLSSSVCDISKNKYNDFSWLQCQMSGSILVSPTILKLKLLLNYNQFFFDP